MMIKTVAVLLVAALGQHTSPLSLDQSWHCPMTMSYFCKAEGCPQQPGIGYIDVRPDKQQFTRCLSEGKCQTFASDFELSGGAMIARVRHSTATLKILGDLRLVTVFGGLDYATVVMFGRCEPTTFVDTPAAKQ